MVWAYKRLVRACNYTSCTTGVLFTLAAIPFVYDTNLLIRAQHENTSNTESMFDIQQKNYDWAMLVMETGGELKPKKCDVSINLYKFVDGKARLKTKAKLPNIPILVPQKHGCSAIINVLEPTHSSKTLGLWTNKAGECDEMNEGKEAKGLDKESHLRHLSNKGIALCSL